jgi:acyl-CoA thioesterase-1
MTTSPAFAGPIKTVVLGDSLSAGLGLSASDAFPAKLQKALKDKGIDVDIVNAGVSGDTASGGRDRLDWSVGEGTEAVIVELGANDALRGTDPSVTQAALSDILGRLKARGIAVLLCGMLAPPNYGRDYADRFNAIYPALAHEKHFAHGRGISRHDKRQRSLKAGKVNPVFCGLSSILAGPLTSCASQSHITKVEIGVGDSSPGLFRGMIARRV